jgi:hypothetical protein
MTQLLTHGKIALLCFCAPKPCHGDVIAEIIFQMMDDRHEDEQQQKRDYLRGEE